MKYFLLRISRTLVLYSLILTIIKISSSIGQTNPFELNRHFTAHNTTTIASSTTSQPQAGVKNGRHLRWNRPCFWPRQPAVTWQQRLHRHWKGDYRITTNDTSGGSKSNRQTGQTTHPVFSSSFGPITCNMPPRVPQSPTSLPDRIGMPFYRRPSPIFNPGDPECQKQMEEKGTKDKKATRQKEA